jgi:ferredoxin
MTGMRVHIDRDSCIGSGNCVLTAPEVFDQDEHDGVVRLRTSEPPAAQHAAVREAADRCPAAVISIADRPDT